MQKIELLRLVSLVIVLMPTIAQTGETTALQEIMQGLRKKLAEIVPNRGAIVGALLGARLSWRTLFAPREALQQSVGRFRGNFGLVFIVGALLGARLS